MRPTAVFTTLVLIVPPLLSSALPNPVADGALEARATGEAIAAVVPVDDDPIDITLPYPVQQCQQACKGKFVTCTAYFGLQFCRDHRKACKDCCLSIPNGNYCTRTYFPPNLPKE